MQYLWRYIDTMYHLPAFLESCPADQDIIHHYKLQLGMKMSKHEELEEPSITKTVPSGKSNGNGDHHYSNGHGAYKNGSGGSSVTADDD